VMCCIYFVLARFIMVLSSKEVGHIKAQKVFVSTIRSQVKSDVPCRKFFNNKHIY
jgi:uncharacterized membrane protein